MKFDNKDKQVLGELVLNIKTVHESIEKGSADYSLIELYNKQQVLISDLLDEVTKIILGKKIIYTSRL